MNDIEFAWTVIKITIIVVFSIFFFIWLILRHKTNNLKPERYM